MLSLALLRARKALAALSRSRCRRALVREGVLAAFEHKYVLTLARFLTIVDVGANRGQFSLAARALNPGSQIIAFEPLPLPADKFERVLTDDSLTELHRFALSDREGSEQMHVSMKSDSSSLLPIGARQVALFPSSAEVGTATVQLKRLDQVLAQRSIRPPALLKIDVQGTELDVLQGSIVALRSFDYVYVECSFLQLYDDQPVASEVIDFLREHGFRLSGAYNLYFDQNGQSIQGDLLFYRVVSECD